VAAVLMIISVSAPIYAATGEGNSAAPCYDHMSSCRAYIEADGSDLTATGIVGVDGNCVVKITLTIQKSLTGKENSWSTHKTFPVATIQSGYTRGVEKTAASAPSGYYYRTKAYITIYINGALVESDTVYSSSVYVS